MREVNEENMEIIGRGTWIDKVAWETIERRKEFIGEKGEFRAESGLGASGFPHIGSLGDAVRGYGIKLAFEDMGYNAKLIAFSDDTDGLRKIPSGLPDSLKDYLGFPVTSVPDPFKCHDSYGEHMSSLLLDALDKSGIEYEFASAKKLYEAGVFTSQIERILSEWKKAGRIIREETEQEKYVEVLPFHAVCSNCGRIYTTKALEFLASEKKVAYVCEGLEIKGKKLEGCGNEDFANYSRGGGKLSWKVEFAARWAALKIDFEAYGKDIADSVRVNDRISREILGYEPPYHIMYEMFLDKGGKKISKSAGNVFTPQVWLRYGSPQSLLLLLFKRFEGTRAISVDDVPKFEDEFEHLEDFYFSGKRFSNRAKDAKLRGLYEYCCLLNPPKEPRIHVPYKTLVHLIKVAPKDFEEKFLAEKLLEYDYIKRTDQIKEIKEKIERCRNWVEDFERKAVKKERREIEISLKEMKALKDVIEVLEIERSGEKIQEAIFKIAKKHGIKPKTFFKLLYFFILGEPQGPKLGPYIAEIGALKISKILSEKIKKV
ncbi:MAG: lysine--tRNA ligase [Candidatus Wukongarchaeota archaeon]|nr:lysine--tRNA ligase [Candidatus Wukongarchaeota archaeon]